MTEWFYLAFSFALLSLLQRGQGQNRYPGEITRKFYVRLFAAVGQLVVIQNICSLFVWEPSGRNDWGTATLFLWATLLDWSMNGSRKKDRGPKETRLVVSRFSLALFAFSYWTLGNQGVSASPMKFFWGLGLPIAAGFFEWLLGGVWDRLRLSRVPARIQGAPALIWLAMTLALAICKLG